jgi:hypothetical protein
MSRLRNLDVGRSLVAPPTIHRRTAKPITITAPPPPPVRMTLIRVHQLCRTKERSRDERGGGSRTYKLRCCTLLRPSTCRASAKQISTLSLCSFLYLLFLSSNPPHTHQRSVLSYPWPETTAKAPLSVDATSKKQQAFSIASFTFSPSPPLEGHPKSWLPYSHSSVLCLPKSSRKRSHRH